MSLYLPPIDQILAEIKRLNPKASLVESDYNYGNPVVLNPTVDGRDTTIRVSAKGPASPYDGEVTVSYTRWPMGKLSSLIGTELRISGVTTTLDVAIALNEQFGFGITSNDIDTTVVNLTNGSGPVTLVSKATSRGWTGQVTFNITPGRFRLETNLLVKRLPGLLYPNRRKDKPYAELYSYPRDFSGHYAALRPIAPTTSPEILEEIKNILVAATGDAWSSTEVRRYSLLNAEVKFNGLTSHQSVSNDDYEWVMVISLTDDCQGLAGDLIIHYSDPDGGIED